MSKLWVIPLSLALIGVFTVAIVLISQGDAKMAIELLGGAGFVFIVTCFFCVLMLS